MILSRYFLKAIFSYTATISVIFILIIVSSRSIQYLEQASRGEIDPAVVFSIVFFRIPEFLELILPISFFLSIVLIIGKLRAEGEFVIMEQSGFSSNKIYKLLALPALCISSLLFFFSYTLGPNLDLKVNNLLKAESLVTSFNSLSPGKFHKLNDSYLMYSKGKQGSELNDIFLVVKDIEKESNALIVAEKFYLINSSSGGLGFETGNSYSEIEPNNLMTVKFQRLALNSNFAPESNVLENLKQDNSLNSLIWASSISFMTLLSIFIALPLCERSPRKGKYSRILPSLLIFSTYIGLLLSFKGGEVENIAYLFVVHLVFIIFSSLLNFYMYKA